MDAELEGTLDVPHPAPPTGAADDAKDAATVEKAGFVDLGVIKGNIGDQNYTLGSDLDLAKYRAVSIWCKRFSVNFGAAGLRPAQTPQNQ